MTPKVLTILFAAAISVSAADDALPNVSGLMTDENERVAVESVSKIYTDWKESKDKLLSISLATEKTTFKKKEAVVLRCIIKNLSDKPITLLRPFGDYFYAVSSGLTIDGPTGKVVYSGPMKEYALGTSAFVELKSGSVCEGTLDLSEAAKYLDGFGKPGKYTITYAYRSGGFPTLPTPANFWNGKIGTGVQTILIDGRK